jgi:hypothetical protein
MGMVKYTPFKWEYPIHASRASFTYFRIRQALSTLHPENGTKILRHSRELCKGTMRNPSGRDEMDAFDTLFPFWCHSILFSPR